MQYLIYFPPIWTFNLENFDELKNLFFVPAFEPAHKSLVDLRSIIRILISLGLGFAMMP